MNDDVYTCDCGLRDCWVVTRERLTCTDCGREYSINQLGGWPAANTFNRQRKHFLRKDKPLVAQLDQSAGLRYQRSQIRILSSGHKGAYMTPLQILCMQIRELIQFAVKNDIRIQRTKNICIKKRDAALLHISNN